MEPQFLDQLELEGLKYVCDTIFWLVLWGYVTYAATKQSVSRTITITKDHE